MFGAPGAGPTRSPFADTTLPRWTDDRQKKRRFGEILTPAGRVVYLWQPMAEHYLGRHPDVYDTCSEELQRQIVKDVLDNFDAGISYESCCWAADCPPDVFTRWRNADPRLEKACRKRLALLEKQYVRVMRGKLDPETGEKPSLAESKMAHEALKQTNRYWAPKTGGAQIGEGLVELQKSLPPAMYALVVSTLHKYVDA